MMVLRFSEGAAGGAEWVSKSTMGGAARGTTVVSLLLICIVLIIVMGTYYHTSVARGGWTRKIRTIVIVAALITVVMYVHDHALHVRLSEVYADRASRDMFAEIHRAQTTGAGEISVRGGVTLATGVARRNASASDASARDGVAVAVAPAATGMTVPGMRSVRL